jgi:hypothetical protein
MKDIGNAADFPMQRMCLNILAQFSWITHARMTVEAQLAIVPVGDKSSGRNTECTEDGRCIIRKRHPNGVPQITSNIGTECKTKHHAHLSETGRDATA